MGARRGPTKPRGTPAGDQSPEDGRSFDDGKPSRRNRHEGRSRETVAAPVGGKASKWESRERCREGTLPSRSDRDQTVMRVEPGRRIEPSRKARRGSFGPCAVETQNLRRAIVNGRSSRGDRCANTRRAGLTLRGMPIRMSDVRNVRRGRREPLPSSEAKLTGGESRGNTG
jgi:hypothetical protein